MDVSKMTQKQFQEHFKKKMRKFQDNMCKFCKHNDLCELPLHGHAAYPRNTCPDWDEPELVVYLAKITEHFYGKDLKDKMMIKLVEEAYGL